MVQASCSSSFPARVMSYYTFGSWSVWFVPEDSHTWWWLWSTEQGRQAILFHWERNLFRRHDTLCFKGTSIFVCAWKFCPLLNYWQRCWPKFSDQCTVIWIDKSWFETWSSGDRGTQGRTRYTPCAFSSLENHKTVGWATYVDFSKWMGTGGTHLKIKRSKILDEMERYSLIENYGLLMNVKWRSNSTANFQFLLTKREKLKPSENSAG